MKFIPPKVKNIVRNSWALLTSDKRKVAPRDISDLMVQQLGGGWINRLMAVRGKLKPSSVETVINDASSRKSGAIGKLFELMYYVTNDARIGGMLDKRISAVSRVMWNLEPGNKDNSTSVDAANFLDSYLTDIRFKGFLESAMDGKLYGVTGFHNVVYDAGSHYVFKDPTSHQISQSRWWQERSNEDNWGELYLKTRQGKKLFLNRPDDIHPAQISAFIYKHKKGYYDTTGIMARVLRLYTFKVWTLVFLSQLVERHGKPFIYTVLNENDFKNDEFKSTVKRVLQQFGAERWGIFPEGFEMEALETNTPGQADMHINLLNYINTELAIALLGQNLSTEVQGGSFAAASSHVGVEQRLTETDLEWLEEQINDHFLYWLIQINYPELDTSEYPKLSLTQIKDVDVEKVARGYKALAELVDVPVAEIREKAQTRAPRVKEGAPEDATGAARYDEAVVGPSTTRRASTLDNFLNNLGS